MGWEPTGRRWGAESQLARGRAFEAVGQLEEARDAYQLAISDEDGGTGVELLLLAVLTKLGDDDRAVALAAALEQRGVQSVQIWVTRGHAACGRNDWEGATVAARTAITIDHQCGRAWDILHHARRNVGDRHGAMWAAEELVRLAPDSLPTLELLADDCKALGNYAKAAVTAMEVVKRAQHDGDAWYNLACYRCLAGDADRALEALAMAVSINSHNARCAKDDRDFDSMRGDARFVAMIE